MTPTQRSLKKLRDEGYLADVVERRIPYSMTTKDLYGFLDLLAIREGEILGVQVTSGSNASARVKKIAEHENIGAVRKSGMRVVVHAWRKLASGRVECRVIDLS